MYKHNFFPINQISSRPSLACRSPIPFSSYPDSISVLSGRRAVFCVCGLGCGSYRAAYGPAYNFRAGPCRPTGGGCGPSPGTGSGPGQPGHSLDRARPCLGRAKLTVLRAG